MDQLAHPDGVDPDPVVAAGVAPRRVRDDLDEVARGVVDVPHFGRKASGAGIEFRSPRRSFCGRPSTLSVLVCSGNVVGMPELRWKKCQLVSGR